MRWKMAQICSILWAGCVNSASDSMASDWPQILGPNRNGQAEGERLMEKWPPGGPQVLWKTRLGSGYAGAAVVGNNVIAFHRQEST